MMAYDFAVRGPLEDVDLGFLAMADDDEAFYFAYDIIRDLTQPPNDQYAGSETVITQGKRNVDCVRFNIVELPERLDEISKSNDGHAYRQQRRLRIIRQLEQQSRFTLVVQGKRVRRN
jgi:hypothetical protein